VDFLTKPVNINQLIERIQAELQHAAQMSEQNKEDEYFRRRLNSLTPRELDILPMVIAGTPNKVIAQLLCISFRTVELHRTNILRKTGVVNFIELARLCEAVHFSFTTKRENP
jgi:FixJ family two-component response regulator